MEWVDCSRGTWKREAAVSPNELGEEGWILPKRVECAGHSRVAVGKAKGSF